MNDLFANGSIIRYPYLWRWQQAEGRVNAEKDRPVCLALKVPDPRQNLTHLVLLAISGTEPYDAGQALEIPPLEIKRAHLSLFKRAWVTVGEYNYDIAERSYFLEHGQKPRGAFSAAFLEEIRQALRPTLAARSGRIDRTL